MRALVTGASSGIGREFALQLAANGFGITAVARRESQLAELLQALPPGEHDYLVADLASAEGVQKACDALALKHYDLLVNNAGLSALEPFYQSSRGVQETILAVNCGAVVTLAHAFLKQAKAGDALINLSSVVAYLPTPAQPVYSGSKAFIAAFSECLWEEQRHRGVYVMGLCPGVTESEFILRASGGKSDGQSMPRAFIQTSTQVVQEALRALRKRRRAIVVTGRVNRLMMWLPHLLSRHRLIKLLAVIGDPERALKSP